MGILIGVYVSIAIVSWFVFLFIAEMNNLMSLRGVELKDIVKVTIAALIWPVALVTLVVSLMRRK